MGEGNWNESDLWQREAEENGLQTEPELQNAVQSPKQIRKTCRREVRRVCNVLGWALAFFSVMTVLVSILLEVAGNVWADGGVISTFLNRMVNAAWYEDGGSTLVIYALVLPFVFLILRLVPRFPYIAPHILRNFTPSGSAPSDSRIFRKLKISRTNAPMIVQPINPVIRNVINSGSSVSCVPSIAITNDQLLIKICSRQL